MRSLQDLLHHSAPLPEGGEVIALDRGAVITEEAAAMLGALHSRSIGGIRGHLEMLSKKGSDAFMDTFYVGYGHKSIGDLGQAAVFIEGVSMLAAKAIQDFPLYNGQESSTRYIDFSRQRFMNPADTEEGAAIQERWRSFYLSGTSDLIPALAHRYPREENESEMKYEKAIKARALDIMRSFLPAGCATNLCWYGELRQFADRLPILRNHPLSEVRVLAKAIADVLGEAYPHSGFDKQYKATEEYHAFWQSKGAYYFSPKTPDFRFDTSRFSFDRVGAYYDAMSHRPPKVELPYGIRECGVLGFDFLLDFGSWRDIQRQRAVAQLMPLLTDVHGFEPWYLEQLPDGLREWAEKLIALNLSRAQAQQLGLETQYYRPMGLRVSNRIVGDLRAHTYLVELRATSVVHPTLRRRAVQMGEALTDALSEYGYVLHLEPDSDRFNVERGGHDIVRRA